MNHNPDFPAVTVVIPAFNSESTIKQCLESIRSLDYPKEKLEIVVVDNGSEDGTPRLAAYLGAKVLVRPRIYVSEMRNTGALESEGEVLAFIDSDCIVSPDWLKNGLQHLREPKVGAAGCGYAISPTPCWIERHWFYHHMAPPAKTTFLPAGNMLIRKKLFSEIGGFDPSLETGEDSDLCLRLRKKGYYVISDGSIKNVHLGNPKSLLHFLRKEIWYGKGLSACLNTTDWKDKTFLLTNVFLIALFLVGAGVVQVLLTGRAVLLFWGFIGITAVVGTSTAYRTIRRRALSSFPHLALLNLVYFFGRSISLAQIYVNLSKRFVRTKNAFSH